MDSSSDAPEQQTQLAVDYRRGTLTCGFDQCPNVSEQILREVKGEGGYLPPGDYCCFLCNSRQPERRVRFVTPHASEDALRSAGVKAKTYGGNLIAAALTPSPLRVLGYRAGRVGLVILVGVVTVVLRTWMEAEVHSLESSNDHARIDLRGLNRRMPEHLPQVPDRRAGPQHVCCAGVSKRVGRHGSIMSGARRTCAQHATRR